MSLFTHFLSLLFFLSHFPVRPLGTVHCPCSCLHAQEESSKSKKQSWGQLALAKQWGHTGNQPRSRVGERGGWGQEGLLHAVC